MSNMPRKGGGFTSYIDRDGEELVGEAMSSVTLDDFQMDDMQYEDLQPNLLPGEMVISKAKGVLRFTPYTDQRQGTSGCLFCTNFKLAFVTSDDHDGQSVFAQRHKLLTENDIPLNNIDATYQVSKSGKRKRVYPGASVSGNKQLEVCCKDFRVVTFSFKFSPKQEAKLTSMAIIHHAFPTRLELLFVFEYKGDTQPGVGSQTPRYRTLADWEAELMRLNVKNYKALQFNASFRQSESLPEVIIVPSSLTSHDICTAAQQYINYRAPTWSYSHSNGAALVRMAYLVPETTMKHLHTKIIEGITKAHPKERVPAVFDLGLVLPSIKDIKISYEKLRDLCMPGSTIEESDSGWHSALDGTHWLQTVSDCIKVTVHVADRISGAAESVIIKEHDGRDLTAVISCLAQLLLDPHSRTILGFQSLVEREWVSLGHRFTDRCGLLHNSQQENCPVFLLFLDCVWQLTQQFPSAFQFSETYLTVVWDSVNLGLFENFVFNSERERSKASHSYYSYNPSDTRPSLMSVWDWTKQFDQDFLSLGKNPLYMIKTEMNLRFSEDFGGVEESLRNGKNMKEIRERLYRQKLSGLFENGMGRRSRGGMLQPGWKAPYIKFWAYCYLRWVGPLQVVGGGSVMEYLQQCVLVEEILFLQHKLQSMETPYSKSDRRKSSLLFSYMTPEGNSDKSEMLTSSFPYVTGTTPNHMSYFRTPLKNFLENSLIMDSNEELDEI